jgi:3-methyl-2-oxobutanoate hydroxymethyltransferase
MMNMTFSTLAKFVRRYADVAGVMREALLGYRRDVEARTFPSDAESYHLSREMRELMGVQTEVVK